MHVDKLQVAQSFKKRSAF